MQFVSIANKLLKKSFMKNTIKVRLTENKPRFYDPNRYTAEVVMNDCLSLNDIVDEMIKEGASVDKNTILAVIEQFNRKTADLSLSGNSVNTGLLTLRPIVKGPFFDGKYIPDIVILQSSELRQAISETTVEIINKDEVAERESEISRTEDLKKEDSGNSYLGVSTDDPACGAAFRAWLYRS